MSDGDPMGRFLPTGWHQKPHKLKNHWKIRDADAKSLSRHKQHLCLNRFLHRVHQASLWSLHFHPLESPCPVERINFEKKRVSVHAKIGSLAFSELTLSDSLLPTLFVWGASWWCRPHFSACTDRAARWRGRPDRVFGGGVLLNGQIKAMDLEFKRCFLWVWSSGIRHTGPDSSFDDVCSYLFPFQVGWKWLGQFVDFSFDFWLTVPSWSIRTPSKPLPKMMPSRTSLWGSNSCESLAERGRLALESWTNKCIGYKHLRSRYVNWGEAPVTQALI